MPAGAILGGIYGFGLEGIGGAIAGILLGRAETARTIAWISTRPVRGSMLRLCAAPAEKTAGYRWIASISGSCAKNFDSREEAVAHIEFELAIDGHPLRWTSPRATA